ncbi:MAG: transcriptional repressor [Spirochaetaceae bacterium]|jgi:Fur family peroxide stress response transcriptional regulator|nr:transcriptional repressor [Spirochaetaceae bacterium]
MLNRYRKHSKKRDAILEVLKSTDTHPGAQWVYEKLKPVIPYLSLGTVYRNLNLFREEGDVVSLGVVNGEERFDACTLPHAHVVCKVCGKVSDLSGETLAELLENYRGFPKTSAFGKAALDLIEIHNFTIDIRNTVFYGLCNDCLVK